ncbi:hypothetical protein PIB30_112193, partial [Stylosanthes scabra]|nr:hypothetical protein [Stylosanthes scabra]
PRTTLGKLQQQSPRICVEVHAYAWINSPRRPESSLNSPRRPESSLGVASILDYPRICVEVHAYAWKSTHMRGSTALSP